MFYSHTFLARKGPLGTVWCAAHLQHKLKKSHYTSTHIPSTVERIMCPEVPIALRMSGHLLLGVVRIYSKKVDYLHHDCNVLWVSLRNAFRTVDVNLPENASHAQFNAVTLPETYQLDSIDIDAQLSLDDYGTPDKYLKSQEEITLEDQYSVERELYVRITFDDDITPDLSHSEASLQRDIDPMETDMPPQVPEPGRAQQDPSPSVLSDRRHERFEEGSSLPDIPDIEVMRDYHENDYVNMPHDDIIPLEPNLSPIKNTPEKATDTPPLENISAPRIQSPQSLQRSGPSSPPTDGARVISDSFEHVTPPDLALRSSPNQKEPQRQQRKRKQFFDESIVLTNEFVKKALNDCSDLVKKRRKLPCSALDMWRFRNSKKKEHIFSDPLISGLCADLQTLSSDDLISSKPHLLLSEDAQPEPRAAVSPPVPDDVGVVIERLRSPDHDPGHYFRPELGSSSLQLTPPHSQGNAETSSSPGIPSSVSEPRIGTATETGSDRSMFTISTGLGMETPVTNFEEAMDYPNTALSDIPELANTVESDELSFLEQDNNSPLDSQGPSEGNSMSVRTRAVAQYLQNHSPVLKYSDGSSGNLSLNNILQGRSRKLCARMFYETLVLKDYGLIDVRQDEPYGDVTLVLTPTLSTTKI